MLLLYFFTRGSHMLEKLANLQHEIWSHWMTYLFEVSTLNEDGSVTIPADKVERWKRQMKTHYLELPINEKKSDLEQAQKVIDVIDGLA
jgi:hypothetical protein